MCLCQKKNMKGTWRENPKSEQSEIREILEVELPVSILLSNVLKNVANFKKMSFVFCAIFSMGLLFIYNSRKYLIWKTF